MKKICTLVFFATLLFSTNLFASQEKTPIFDAVKKGDLNEVKRLVEGGADPHVVDRRKRNLIHVAASGGHTRIIEYLRKFDVDCNKEDEYDDSPVYFASEQGHLDTLKYLIEKCDANPHVVDCLKRNLIHTAADGGHTHIIEYLKNLGVDCNKKDKCGRTPVYSAIKNGNLYTLKYLIEKGGADPHEIDDGGNNLIYVAAENGRTDIIEYLIKKHKVDYNKKNKYFITPACTAILRGRLGTLKYLIEKCGVDPHEVDDCGDNLIHVASSDGHTHIIEYLAKLGVDCDKKNGEGKTPAYFATKMWHLETLNYLIEKCDANPHVVDVYGGNLIHFAVKNRCTNIVKYLTEKHKVDCNKKNNMGCTPAYFAIKKGHLETFKYLIEECDIDPHAQDLIHIAAEKGKTNIIKYLKNLRVDCNKEDRLGYTPAYFAIEKGHLKTLKYLIEEYDIDPQAWIFMAVKRGETRVIKSLIKKYKVDCNKKDEDGKTPAHFATKKGYLETLKYLIEKGGASPHEVDYRGRNLIHIATKNWNLDIIKYLIEKHKVDCNKKSKYGETPVYFATQKGDLITLKYLIEKGGVDPHTVNEENGRNLIHVAAEKGYEHIIEYLKKLGVDCNKKDKDGRTPVFFATQSGYTYPVEYLIEKCGVNPHVTDKNNCSLINHAIKFYASRRERDPRRDLDRDLEHLAECLLIKKNFDCNKKDNKGFSPFHNAFYSGFLHISALLVACGCVDPNGVGKGCNNLICLSLTNYPKDANVPSDKFVEWLIEVAGADFLKKPGCKHYTPDKSHIKNASRLDKLVKYLIGIKKRPKKNKEYVLSLFEKKETPVLAKIKALNDLAKHKLLPKALGKLFSKVLFGKVFFDHIYACRYALQNNNLEGCNDVTARQAIKRKKWAYEELSVRTAKQILLEKLRIFLMWPEFIPSVLYNYGLYEKTKLRCLLGLEEKLVENPKNKKTALNHILQTKQLAKTTANNPYASLKDKRYSKQFGKSLNNAAMCLWHLSKIMPHEVAAKTLTYASIK